MSFEQFIERFGELGWKETRTATTRNYSGLPDDNYGLIEMYCNDDDCDCRRVIFEVVAEKQENPIAYVSFGWEKVDFYTRWLGGNDVVTAKQLQGPILNPGSPQSKYANAALELVKSVLQDPNFVARIKRHYKIFKQTVKGKPTQKSITKQIPEISESLKAPIEAIFSEQTNSKTRKRHSPRRTDN